MHKGEFRDWFDYHAAAFSGLRPWLDKQRDPDAVMESWARAMARIDADDARRATDLMAQDESLVPKGWDTWDAHRGRVIQLARRMQTTRRHEASAAGPTIIDGEIVYRCAKCQDSGGLEVWSMGAMRAARKGLDALQIFLGPQTRRKVSAPPVFCAVACDCEMGRMICTDDRPPDKHSGMMRRFDPDRMLPVRSMAATDFPEEQEALVARMAGAQPAGYHREFAEFE